VADQTVDQIRQQWGGGENSDIDLWAYLQPLIQRWWVVAPLVVVGAACGLVYSHTVAPIYQSHCRFEIFENKMLRISDASAIQESQFYFFNANPLERHRLLLVSGNLNQEVGERLREKWPAASLAGLSVTPVKDSRVLVDISVRSTAPGFCVDYIHELLRGYKEMRREESTLQQRETLHNLRTEQQRFAEQLEEARDELMAFEASHNIRFDQYRSESDQEHTREILRKGRTIQTEITILESQLSLLETADAALLHDFQNLTRFTTAPATDGEPGGGEATPNWPALPEWRETEGELIRMRSERERMRRTFKPAHPKMLALDRDIELAQQKQQAAAELTLKRLRARLKALTMEAKGLEEAAEQIKSGLSVTAGDMAKHEKLKAEVERWKALHDRASHRIIDSAGTAHDRYFTRIVEGPGMPGAPVYPLKWRMVLQGMMAGAGLGIAIIYLLFFRAARFYNLEIAERLFGLQLLGVVGRITHPEFKKNPLALNEIHRADPICEGYRSIRTALEERIGDAEVLVFTSPDQADGKTFTSANTAVAWTWSNRRVLLIEGDIRRPALRRMLLLDKEEQGLIECLTDADCNWRDCIVPVAENLDLLPAGRSSGHGAELLQTSLAAKLLDNVREAYDLVIIDSAPVNRVVDTQLLCRLADAVVVIARPGHTSVSALRLTMHRLAAANVVGYIANQVTARNQWYYGSYGGYGYYYGGYRNYYYGYGDQRSAESDAPPDDG
jgi:capsular exopolysaccharide synthesis family protein